MSRVSTDIGTEGTSSSQDREIKALATERVSKQMSPTYNNRARLRLYPFWGGAFGGPFGGLSKGVKFMPPKSSKIRGKEEGECEIYS